ncbi:hypothetical protein CEE37_14910 [candidate division LCP-89 bacterium B3_LCP]|uniref:CHAT domain-containing protein n=1 Tax=candidate division LCP-89 bacterium B3_LCP TaxID=2012998 RepID=A0A532UNR1_UNCL8|nr:MAG: hypothetical protein CEE37_14910 [candidate division LCP-89 bacterium B3_LCP]
MRFKLLIVSHLLFAVAAYSQQLDTLKIKSEADSLFAAGKFIQRLWPPDERFELYKSALKLYKLIGDREGETEISRRLGIHYVHRNNFQEALFYLEKVLAIYVEIGDRKKEVKVLYHLGDLYRNFSLFPRAFDYYQQGLELAKQIGDRHYECYILFSLGIAYHSLSNYPKSLEHYRRSLILRREIDDINGEAWTLYSIGLVYSNLYDFPNALDYSRRSLEIFEFAKNRNGESYVLNCIGMIYKTLADYQKALHYFQQSLAVKRELKEPIIESIALKNIGTIYTKLSDYPEAMEYYLQSLEVAREVGNRRSEGLIFNDIGKLYLAQKKYPEALEYNEKAMTIASELGKEEDIQACYSTLGDYYAVQELDSLAVVNYGEAIASMERIREKLEFEGQKSCYASGVTETYEVMVLTLLRLHREEEAYAYVERAQARSFLDLLTSGGVIFGKGKDKEFLQRERELQNQKKEIEKQLIAAADDAKIIAELVKRIKQNLRSISALIEEKKLHEPELVALVTVNSETLSEVQQLLDHESTILEYFLTKEKTLIWRITPNEAELFQVSINSDSLINMVKGFRDAIVYFGKGEYLSRDLCDILIAPVAETVKTEKLIIIPHGILHYLPFGALQDGKGKYLLDQYEISYLPSASVIRYLKSKERDKGENILAFGNPEADHKDYKPIPFSEKEVKDISRYSSKTRVLTGADATETRFRELAPNFDILHLACHAELNSAYPLFSGLLLAPDDNQDGELDVHEIFTMDLNAYLVVLSGCQTGLGHLTNGDELVGLTRAFIYAGTPTIISSLWMVDDESTAFLMKNFYQNLRIYGKAESLRKAQLETMKVYQDTHSWASFILIGSSE